MTHTNTITGQITEAIYTGSNEAYDIYFVSHNGFSDYKRYPRNAGYDEQDVIDDLLS